MDRGNINTRHNGAKNMGRLGEELAASFLADKGYQILCRNFQWRYGEVDIVVRKGRLLSFVEVKTRSQSDYGTPAEAVTREKRKKIECTARHYMQRFGMSQMDAQLGVIEIRIDHIQNI